MSFWQQSQNSLLNYSNMKCGLIQLKQTSATRYSSMLINTKHILEFCSQSFVWIENYILSVQLICTHYINIFDSKILIKSVFAAWRRTRRITKKNDGSPMNRRSSGKKASCYVWRKFLFFMVAGNLIAYLAYKSPPLASAFTRRTKFTIFKSLSLNCTLILSSVLKLYARSDLFASGSKISVSCAFVVTHL